MSALIYHGTPLTPAAALDQLAGRAFCISFPRRDDVVRVERIGSRIMYDCGPFTYWKRARAAGREWEEEERAWTPYFTWLETRLFTPGRWAIIPDRIAAPSQLNDALLNQWPHGRSRGAPVWHMDEPIGRLARLCAAYDRVCFGWVGEFDPAIGDVRPEQRAVGCAAYRRRMDEVAAFFGNAWHPIHQLRGTHVAFDYPFDSADSTSLAQNSHRYRKPLFAGTPDEYRGLIAYADKLEGIENGAGGLRIRVSGDHRDATRPRGAPRPRSADQSRPDEPRLW